MLSFSAHLKVDFLSIFKNAYPANFEGAFESYHESYLTLIDEIGIKRSVYDPWHVEIDQAEQDLLNEETDFSRVAPNTRAIDD